MVRKFFPSEFFKTQIHVVSGSFVLQTTFHRASCSAGVVGEGVESQQATLHGKRGAAVEAAQRRLVQPQEVPHIFCYPLPVTEEFWLLPQPQRFSQMTLSECGETV